MHYISFVRFISTLIDNLLNGIVYYEAAHKLHEEIGCICYENPQVRIYFIQDPDGYWLEGIPQR